MQRIVMRAIAAIIVFALLSTVSFAEEHQSLCDYKVGILVDGDEFDKESFKWRMKAVKIEGKSTNITGTAEIEDSNGKAVKSYKPWTSEPISRQKTSSEYSPNLKAGKYKITAEIDVECSDSNKGNNMDTKTIEIKGEKVEKSSKESASNVQSGEKGKKAASQEKNNKINNNEAKTIQKKPKTQSVEGTGNAIQLAKNNNKNAGSQPMASIPSNSIKGSQVVYESANEKVKGLILIFLLTLSVLFNITLIWKR